MPPLCSIVRIPFVVTRRLIGAPRISDIIEVSCRFGRNRRRVLLFAWLTLLPDCTVLPVISQRRDIRNLKTTIGARACLNLTPATRERRAYRQSTGKGQAHSLPVRRVHAGHWPIPSPPTRQTRHSPWRCRARP